MVQPTATILKRYEILMKILYYVIFSSILIFLGGNWALRVNNQGINKNMLSLIKSGFGVVARLKMMKPGEKYSFKTVQGTITGTKEDFLRKRSPEEVLEHGRASGCGDYALVFANFMEKQGIVVKLIESAQISFISLKSNFAGHLVVAILDQENNRWILADPTRRRIISDNWDIDKKSFVVSNTIYWIGFKGSLSEYRSLIDGPEKLKNFYKLTLQNVPKNILEEELFDLEFVVDSSMYLRDGSMANENVDRFIRRVKELYSQFFMEYNNISPRKIKVTFMRGNDSVTSKIRYSKKRGWVCIVGDQSDMRIELLQQIENAIVKHKKKNCVRYLGYFLNKMIKN